MENSQKLLDQIKSVAQYIKFSRSIFDKIEAIYNQIPALTRPEVLVKTANIRGYIQCYIEYNKLNESEQQYLNNLLLQLDNINVYEEEKDELLHSDLLKLTDYLRSTYNVSDFDCQLINNIETYLKENSDYYIYTKDISSSVKEFTELITQMIIKKYYIPKRDHHRLTDL